MSILRITTGLLLVFAVSITNGVAGLVYTLGGDLGPSAPAVSGEAVPTPPLRDGERLQDRPDGGVSRNPGAAVLRLLETRTGRFGVGLQILCLLQFIAGAIVVLRPRAGGLLTSYLLVVAALGLWAEYAGFQFTSSWSVFNSLGAVASGMLLPVSFAMYRAGALRR